MKKSAGFLLVVLCVALMGATPAPPEPDYTVGEFAVRVVKMITQKTEYTPETASMLLDKLGVELEGELGDPVSEALLVETFSQLGVTLTTTSPERRLTRPQVDRLMGLFDNLGGPATEFHSGPANSIKCKDGVNKGDHCFTDADCPGSFCNIPPGQAKKIASPIDP